jgi:hypothetical protein
VGADRGRPLPPRTRRQHRPRLCPPRAPARARPGPTQGGAPVRQGRQLASGSLPPPSPPLKARERLTERERRRLCALFEREPPIAEAWAQGDVPLDLPCPRPRRAERRLDHFLAAVERAQLPAFTAFADGVQLWRAELLAYFDEPTTNGYAEGIINKVKPIKRRADALPSFGGFRHRVLLACP